MSDLTATKNNHKLTKNQIHDYKNASFYELHLNEDKMKCELKRTHSNHLIKKCSSLILILCQKEPKRNLDWEFSLQRIIEVL